MSCGVFFVAMMATQCASSMRYEYIDIGRHVTTMKVWGRVVGNFLDMRQRHTGYHFVWRDSAVGRQLVLSAILRQKRKMEKNKKAGLGEGKEGQSRNIGIEEKVGEP